MLRIIVTPVINDSAQRPVEFVLELSHVHATKREQVVKTMEFVNDWVNTYITQVPPIPFQELSEKQPIGQMWAEFLSVLVSMGNPLALEGYEDTELQSWSEYLDPPGAALHRAAEGGIKDDADSKNRNSPTRAAHVLESVGSGSYSNVVPGHHK